MEALGAAASIAGLVSLAIEIPKLIDTAISIQSAPEEAAQLSKTVDALVATLQKLEAFLKSNEAQDMQMANDSALTVSISACQTRILDLSKSLRTQITPVSASSSVNPMSKVKSAIRRFRWPLEKTECLSVITELHAMESTFEFCLVMKNCQQMSRAHKEVISHFKTQNQVLNEMSASFPEQAEHAQSMLSKLETIQLCIEKNVQQVHAIRNGVETIQEMNRDLVAYQADNLHGQALEWLSPLDTTLRHEEIRTDRLPETCEWIVHDAEFRSWCQTLPSDDYDGISCWVGDPGQGKTYTMSRIVEHLQTSNPAGSGAYVTYLYCDYQRTRNHSVTSLIGALIRQLLGQFETLPKEIVDLVRQANLKLRRPSARMDELIRILDLLAPQVKRLFICIDALDENPRAEELVAACCKLPLQKSLFFIGRRSILQSLKPSYSSVSCRSIEPQNGDINAVVTARLATEAIRDPDLMPDQLRAQIKSSITSLANGMFLLSTLHLTLVLSRNTIFQRRLALDDLPTTLSKAFSETLARIRQHIYASQAFRILALIHRFGPLSFEVLQEALAVEPSHTQFQQDNLPSRLTMLDCCMGLVRTVTTMKESKRDERVELSHGTISTYFSSNKHVLEDASIEIAGCFIAILSFPTSRRLQHLRRFVERSWASLLYDLEALPAVLSDKIWNYMVELNEQINDENYGGLTGHSTGLQPEKNSFVELPRKTIGQSLLHTACIIELDGLSSIMERLLSLGGGEGNSHIESLDVFGLSPMGWILLPRYVQSLPWDSDSGYQEPSYKKHFEQKLLRAKRLISMYPRTEPVKSLWNATAMIECQERSRSCHYIPLQFFTAVPLLWFFSNYTFDPKAMQRCVDAMKQYWNLDIWSAIGNAYRLASLPTMSDLQLTSANKWNMIYAQCKELDHFRRRRPIDGLRMSPRDTDTHRSFTPLSPGDWPCLNTGDDHRNILIVFQPGRDVHTPSLVLPSASALDVSCLKTREDIIIHDIKHFPNTDGYVMSLTPDEILRFGKSNKHIDIVNFALSKLKPDMSLENLTGYATMALSRKYKNTVTEILSSHLNIDFEPRGPAKSYLLHYCTCYHSCSAVSDLLKSHIDIDLQDGWGRTALHYAVKIGDLSKVRMFLEEGAGIDIVDFNGRTALHYGIETGTRQMVEILMKEEPDVNIVDWSGRTPLHLAIIRRDLPICQILLDPRHASDITPRNLQIAWHIALRPGGEFATRLLCSVQSSSLRLPGDREQHPSTALTHSNKIRNMVVSTGESSKLTIYDLQFMTRLAIGSNDYSASTGRKSITSHTSSRTYNWSATICSAIESRADFVATCLLRMSLVEVDHLQRDGETALHLAVIYDTCRVFQLLLDDEKIDTTAENSEGYTALHLTLVHKNLDFLWVMLCSPRIDVGQEVRGTGATALHLAIRHNFLDAVPLLLACPQINFDKLDGSGRAVLHHAVLKQDVALVKLLLGCRMLTPTIPSRDGRTALAYAALCAGEEMIALLLEAGGFDLDLKDTYGKTAIDWARQNGNPRIAEMLEAVRPGTLVTDVGISATPITSSSRSIDSLDREPHLEVGERRNKRKRGIDTS